MSIPILNLDLLAYGCLYILAGKAMPTFPTSTRHHPSYYVRVVPSMGVDKFGLELFPLDVRWDIWESCVVPTLRDVGYQLSTPLNQLRRSGLQTRLRDALERCLEEQALYPEEEDTELLLENTQTGVGEPVVRPAPAITLVYTKYDQET